MQIKGYNVLEDSCLELTVLDGRIVERSKSAERGELFFSPGWLDLQVNGWKGIDYNADTLDASSFESITRELAASGTTRHLPTIITASREDIIRRLSTLRQLREDSPRLNKAIPGFHVEGPFISGRDGFRGAHSLEYVRDPSLEEFDAWQEAAGGLIRIVTLAPERPGSLKFIEELSSRGVVVSIGHSAADPLRIREAVAAGARMSTHLGNGMARTIDRHVNPLWEQLSSDRLTACLIADSHHLPPAFIRTAFKSKGEEGIVLVSDAAVPGGLAPGRMSWAGIDVDLSEDGRISLAGTPYLAGAGLLQKRGVEYLMESTGCTPAAALRACTVNPRRLLGLEDSEDLLAFRLIYGGGGTARGGTVRDGSVSRGMVSLQIEDVWLGGVSVFNPHV